MKEKIISMNNLEKQVELLEYYGEQTRITRRAYAEAKQHADQIRKYFFNFFQKNNATELYIDGEHRLKYVEKITPRFNTKQFREDHPELYEKYLTSTSEEHQLIIIEGNK